MEYTLTSAEHERRTAHLRARLWTEGWSIRDEQLGALARVLPIDDHMPEASLITDTETAFVLGGSLMVASSDQEVTNLTTELFTIAGVSLAVEWDAEWLGAYEFGNTDAVPEERPITVTLKAPSGKAYALPFDAAWRHPAGCINFVTTLIHKAHGFRPSIGTGRRSSDQKQWKR
jgi:hypothetical protein